MLKPDFLHAVSTVRIESPINNDSLTRIHYLNTHGERDAL
jgi:hypothetical protein